MRRTVAGKWSRHSFLGLSMLVAAIVALVCCIAIEETSEDVEAEVNHGTASNPLTGFFYNAYELWNDSDRTYYIAVGSQVSIEDIEVQAAPTPIGLKWWYRATGATEGYGLSRDNDSGTVAGTISKEGTFEIDLIGSFSDTKRLTIHAVSNTTSYTCTLNYNANGGSGAPSTQTYTGTSTSSHNFTISLLKPTRSGHGFLGWSESSTATTASYQAGGTISVPYNGSKTLYAVWEALPTYTYTLSYNANGGSGAPPTQNNTGTSSTFYVKISDVTPTRSGYTFLGWDTDPDATSATYQPKDYIGLEPGDYVTIYAIWQKNEYTCTLSYSANGGSGAPSAQTYTGTSTSSHSFTVSSTEPTRTGYAFLGWADSSSATAASYQPGGTVSVPYNGSKILYAVWQPVIAFAGLPQITTIVAGTQWSYTPSLNTDGCTITVDCPWMTVADGTISGTASSTGTYNVTVTASKDGWTTATQTFAVTVAPNPDVGGEPSSGTYIFSA